MKRYANIYFLFVLSTSLFVQTVSPAMPALPAQPGMESMPAGTPEMSEEQLKNLEAQLEKELQEMINNLSDDERKVFDQTMEKLNQMDEADLERFITGQMNETELEEFLTTIMPEQPQEPTPATAAQPAEPKKTKEPAKPVLNSKQEKALALINSIIARIDSFMVKISAMPEIPGKITSWKQKGTIIAPSGFTWTMLRNDLDSFVRKLRKITERDPQTKEYRHLDALLAQESFYQQLVRLEQQLEKNEPNIEEKSSFGLEKMAKKSTIAIQQVINSLSEILYRNKGIQSLDSLFEQFEPKAAKAREEEKTAADKALAESKMQRQRGQVSAVGSRQVEYPYGASFPSYEQPRTPSHAPSTFSTAPAYEPSRYSEKESVKGGDGKKSSPEKPGKEDKPEKEKGDKDKDKDKDKDGKKADDAKKQQLGQQAGKSAQQAEDTNIMVYRSEIESGLQTINKKIATQPQLSSIESYLTGKDPLDPALNITLGSVLKQATMINENIEKIKNRIDMIYGAGPTKKDAKDRYTAQTKRTIGQLWEKNKKAIESVVKQINDIEQNLDKLKPSISAEKKSALLGITKEPTDEQKNKLEKLAKSADEGDEDAAEELKTLITQFLPQNSILFEVKNALAQIPAGISKLDK